MQADTPGTVRGSCACTFHIAQHPSTAFHCDAMNYQWVPQSTPMTNAPTSYGPMSQPTSLVAPSTPYGTFPTMQIPVPQIQPVLQHPQLQYASTLPPTSLTSQMSTMPNAQIVQIPSAFHTLHPSPQPEPAPTWNPQTLIVAPQSYWPTSPPAAVPSAIPTEHPQSTPVHPSQLPTIAYPPTAVPTPTVPAAPIGQPPAHPPTPPTTTSSPSQALLPGTSQDAPTPTGTTDATQTQAHTSSTAPTATSTPAAATPSTQDTTSSRPPPINITVPRHIPLPHNPHNPHLRPPHHPCPRPPSVSD